MDVCGVGEGVCDGVMLHPIKKRKRLGRSWIVHATNEELEKNRSRLGHLKKYQQEAIIICERKYLSQKDRYKKYMRTLHWFALSKKKRNIVKHCEKCGSSEKLHSHHLGYKNLYDVTLEDLQVLCEKCHYSSH